MKLQIKPFKALSIRAKLGSLLLFFALVALANFFSVRYYKNISRIDTAVVDAAGRQRMLSQKIAFLSSMILRGKEEAREELKKTIELYNTSLLALKRGGVTPGIARNTPLPATHENILPSLLRAENLWKEYKTQAETIQQQPLYIGAPSNVLLDIQGRDLEQVKTMQVLNPVLTTAINLLEQRAPELLTQNDALVKEYVHNSEAKQQALNFLLWLLLTINVLLIMLCLWVVEKYIAKPLGMIRESAQLLARGDLSRKISFESNDEIGIAISGLNMLTDNLQHAALFAESIGRGHFDNDLQTVSQQDVLGNALLGMRNQLFQVEQEEIKRKWATEGIATFSEILHMQHKDITHLAEGIISSLIKYLNANQGTLFIVNDDGDEAYLELLATYAWGKKKYQHKQVGTGEGLVGQAWLEKEIIYMTDVPEGYVEITSGLGKANPRSILIVPLKLNDEVFGMVEIASFKTYEGYELNFVQKVAENIAATLSNTKINYKTRYLLEQAQQQEEELRAQEEEMRQQMEELQATQEELGRSQQEREKELESLKLDYGLKLTEIEKSNQVLEKNKTLLFYALTVDNAVIDVAGRNRMLSQKIAFLCELVSKATHTPGALMMLEQALELHEKSLLVLKEGGEAPGLKHQYSFPPAAPELLPVLTKVGSFWEQYSFHARNILSQQLLCTGLPEEIDQSSFPNQEESLLFIEENSEKMLRLNNELVAKMTEINKGKLDQIEVKTTAKSPGYSFEEGALASEMECFVPV